MDDANGMDDMGGTNGPNAGAIADTNADTIAGWLERLASADPAPGGGAAAAMQVAIGAALVSMVTNLTIGKPVHAAHEENATQVRERADALRAEALRLGREDEAAFTALMTAYRLPRTTEEERTARRDAVRSATHAAALPPLAIAAAAADVVALAESLRGRSNPHVVSDLAVAAAAAAGAAESAAVNVEVNLSSLPDGDVKAELTADLEEHLAVAERGRALVADIRRELTR
ncbi:cyclodeaminase/cyclohydrolase family protein [Actinopolymorpha singaporensis]|uniref:Formiminotetrahydrofolate cyclodeaminase n=1 Tax=Actinopolymorpha singaporensis TaxID=117157 RepID=A0A1H1LM86_9ACTN|nr:cyclodeaminase/cyclohydrolase family protein [Actinopolymorpha singaporensis]SDR75631.1 Formiminotetrahydrofolate cyclodeaminase [Actinopolymorpha singaporensis]